MTYHQLTEPERYLISQLRKTGHGVAEIARVLGRHRSTIYRECRRNATQHVARGLTVYCPSKASSNVMAGYDEVAAAHTMMLCSTPG